MEHVSSVSSHPTLCTPSEAIATHQHVCNDTETVRNTLNALNRPQGTTWVGTDNSANMQLATMTATPGRSRNCLRVWAIVQARVQAGECAIGHIPDAENPTDFLTKWVSRSKSTMSLQYLTNTIPGQSVAFTAPPTG